jgi:hypothetical protein
VNGLILLSSSTNMPLDEQGFQEFLRKSTFFTEVVLRNRPIVASNMVRAKEIHDQLTVSPNNVSVGVLTSQDAREQAQLLEDLERYCKQPPKSFDEWVGYWILWTSLLIFGNQVCPYFFRSNGGIRDPRPTRRNPSWPNPDRTTLQWNSESDEVRITAVELARQWNNAFSARCFLQRRNDKHARFAHSSLRLLTSTPWWFRAAIRSNLALFSRNWKRRTTR